MPKQILQKYWGHEEFRPQQEAIINSILEGSDTFVLLPTGGGKSICYQLPALMIEGFCLVVSPLVALMHDQVLRLKSMDISAVYLHAAQSKREVELELQNLRNGKYKLAYVSPERLQSDLFKSYLDQLPISFLAIDEAHCISQWGYDFRPAYLNILSVREVLPKLKIIALTASATPEVQVDIIEKLSLKEVQTFKSSFHRNNLKYQVRETENKRAMLLSVCRRIRGSGVVYAGTRAKVMELSNWLQQEGVSCNFYHAGLSSKERSERQADWLKGKCDVIISTNAFGMGIDKADVRYVVHYAPPNSLEAYYQEAGRAGRDGDDALCMLLFNDEDLKRDKIYLASQYPSLETLQRMYESLCNHLQIAMFGGKGSSYPFDLADFSAKFEYRPVDVHYAMKKLEVLGYISVFDGFNPASTVKIEMDATALYDFQLRHEKFEPLIKLLLRTHGGIFDQFISIAESQISTKLKIGEQQLKSMFFALDRQRILVYQPSGNLPLVTLLTERVSRITDTDKRLGHLESSQKKRMQEMHRYVQNEGCRARQLCRYFGEAVKETCGNCDICSVHKRNAMTRSSFESIANQLKEAIGRGASGVKDLLNTHDQLESEQYKDVLRWLLDDGTIEVGEKRILHWRG